MAKKQSGNKLAHLQIELRDLAESTQILMKQLTVVTHQIQNSQAIFAISDKHNKKDIDNYMKSKKKYSDLVRKINDYSNKMEVKKRQIAKEMMQMELKGKC